MGEHTLHTLISAANHRVQNVQLRWSSMTARQSHMADECANCLGVNAAIWNPGRIPVTIGSRHRNSVHEMLRPPAVFELFDVSGADDITAMFAGGFVHPMAVGERVA
jgi:hypothetical protein